MTETCAFSSTRRILLQRASLAAIWAAATVMGCRRRVVREVVQVEKEITRVVTEIVRETVIVEQTEVVERLVERLVTPVPAAQGNAIVRADVTPYGWTQFGISMAPAFEELFPSITIEWRSQSDWHDYPRRVAAMQAAGESGDLLECPTGALLAHWLDTGIIRPIGDIVEADRFDTSGILSGVLRACQRGDQLLGLPVIGHAGENVLLYRRDLFEAAGLEEPNANWTLDDLVSAGAAVSQRGAFAEQPDLSGYAVRYLLPSALPMLSLFGTALFSPDGLESSLNGREGVACLSWAQDAVHRHGLGPKPTLVDSGPLEMFLGGRLAMVRHSFRTLTQLRRLEGMQQVVGSALMPKHLGTGALGGVGTGIAYCIGKRSEIAAETFQWMKFMSSREMGVQMFLGGYAEPGCRLTSWKDPRVLEEFPVCAQVAEAAEAAEPERLPWNLRISSCYDAWNKRIPALLEDESPPEEAAAQVSDEIDAILALPGLGPQELP